MEFIFLPCCTYLWCSVWTDLSNAFFLKKLENKVRNHFTKLLWRWRIKKTSSTPHNSDSSAPFSVEAAAYLLACNAMLVKQWYGNIWCIINLNQDTFSSTPDAMHGYSFQSWRQVTKSKDTQSSRIKWIRVVVSIPSETLYVQWGIHHHWSEQYFAPRLPPAFSRRTIADNCSHSV